MTLSLMKSEGRLLSCLGETRKILLWHTMLMIINQSPYNQVLSSQVCQCVPDRKPLKFVVQYIDPLLKRNPSQLLKSHAAGNFVSGF
jgi:hypothetical protein